MISVLRCSSYLKKKHRTTAKTLENKHPFPKTPPEHSPRIAVIATAGQLQRQLLLDGQLLHLLLVRRAIKILRYHAFFVPLRLLPRRLAALGHEAHAGVHNGRGHHGRATGGRRQRDTLARQGLELAVQLVALLLDVALLGRQLAPEFRQLGALLLELGALVLLGRPEDLALPVQLVLEVAQLLELAVRVRPVVRFARVAADVFEAC